VVASRDQQVKDNSVFTLWEPEPELFDITEWVYAEDPEYTNPALTLALTGRTELTPKVSKIPKPIQNLLKEYDDIISKGSHDLGQMSVIEHKINLVHPFLITARQKTFDPSTQRKIKEEIKRLLDQGII